MYCTLDSSVRSIIDLDQITFHMDNRDQLSSDTIDSTNIYQELVTIDARSHWIFTGYSIDLSFEWVTFNNKINHVDETNANDNDYYLTSIGGTYII